MRHSTFQINACGEQLMLLAEKAVWWAGRQTLLLADTHFGKATTFRRAGIPVPAGTTAMTLVRLTELCDRYTPQRLVVLGDFVHSAVRSERDFIDQLLAWRESFRSLQVDLVLGNHDRGQGKLFADLRLNVTAEPLIDPPLALCHQVQANQEDSRFALAGHLHPAVRVAEHRRSQLTLPCFVVGTSHIILPAFGEFTGCAVVRPRESERVYAIAEDSLFDLTATNA